jgi:hypothetical protein
MITSELARVNPGLLRRIAEQITHDRGETPDGILLAEQIQKMLPA